MRAEWESTERMTHYISEILGQLYQDTRLYRCFYEGLLIDSERTRQIHYIVMNYDRMTSKEIREKAYCYGAMLRDEDLFGRQLFLCLLRLADEAET